jgi:hypothetical protein
MKKKVGKVVSVRLWEHQYKPMKEFQRKRNMEQLKAHADIIDGPDTLRELVEAGLEAKGFKTAEV